MSCSVCWLGCVYSQHFWQFRHLEAAGSTTPDDGSPSYYGDSRLVDLLADPEKMPWKESAASVF